MYYYRNTINGSYLAFDVEMNNVEFVSISKQEYDDHERIRNIDKEIAELKIKLEKTDYKVLKYVEGVLSDEEYIPLKEERQNYRNRINELEGLKCQQ